MASSLRMRRVSPTDLERGVAHLEEGFAATLDNDVFGVEQESGVLCSLGEDWQEVNVLLTGEELPRLSPGALPVLGGDHIASMGSPIDVMLWLGNAEVAEALAFLESTDFQEALSAHQSDLGHLLQVRGEAYLSRLEQLKRFYGLAAQEGQAVVKRVYGHY